MDKLAALACVLLLAGAAVAHPGRPAPWRRASEESPDRDVEVVEPVRGGGSRAGGRGGLVPVEADASDESPQEVPVGIIIRDLGSIGGFGGLGLGGFGPVRPVIVRTLGQPGPRDSTEDSDEEQPGGYLHPYFVDPMSNFMAQMAEMMAAMRRQMADVLSRGGIDREEGPDFSKLGNTTSTTKVVDGHVVTVNETVIGGDDGDSAVLHVRVVDIHPSESPADAEAPGQAATPSSAQDKDSDRDVEPLESSNEVTSRKPSRSENEIPMKPLKRSVRSTQRRAAPARAPARGDMASTGDDGDDDDDVQQYQMPVFEPDTQQSQVPVFDVQQQQVPVFDVQQQQVPVFDMQQQQVPVFDVQQQTQQSGQLRLLPAGTTNNNQVDGFDKPRQQGDLSRDTLVNVILERQHQRGGLIMVDPDAELMDVRDGKVVRAYSPGRPSRPGRQARRTASPSWETLSWTR
ncbi:uncharacterized protein LOC117645651 [Thrips palmi]|uniref:Uncharacterized protein LOC117645651 n=1 Tax=Thrips palmi TaxID=161013 RepID=A0A6P8YX28_THRPL|nr:uncharacterized protein LOC117645651 [Thrips palmi]